MGASILDYRYTEHADCPVVLYLHGFLGCKEDWDEAVLCLADQFTHLQVDLPGHGRSIHNVPDDAYTMAECAQTLVDLLDLLHIASCNVVGYSMGGRLALYLAVFHGDRFGRFLIESASPGLRTATERDERVRHDLQVADMIRSKDADTFLDHWYNQPLFASVDRTGSRFEELLRRRRQMFNRDGLAKSLEHMGAGAQPSLWAHLGGIRGRVLFMAGERDTKFAILTSEMAHLCPNGQVAIIPEVGHNVHFERPPEFCRRVAVFFGSTE
jgi:2-succinyl-6-hydroxy-2,4-cyclohexadiene-1-carboxylate synthase